MLGKPPPFCRECNHSHARHAAGEGTCDCGCVAWRKPTERDLEDGRRVAERLGLLTEQEDA